MEDSSQITTIVDSHGRPWDPYSGGPLDDGQEGPGSIFYVPPPAPSRFTTPPYRLFIDKDTSIPFTEFIERIKAQGYKGGDIFMHITPRPEDVDRIPPPPPPQRDYSDEVVETSVGDMYRTKCNYCYAVVTYAERERGFKLSEICLAAKNGCDTCDVLQRGIKYFAALIFPTYSDEKVRVRQKENGRSRLLSETKAVTLCFDEFGGETIKLTFNGSGMSSGLLHF